MSRNEIATDSTSEKHTERAIMTIRVIVLVSSAACDDLDGCFSPHPSLLTSERVLVSTDPLDPTQRIGIDCNPPSDAQRI